MNALQKQEGGNHYKELKIQPVEYIHANQLGFIEGSVIKYVTRHKQKNGREDILKAIHFLELLMQLEYPVTPVNRICLQCGVVIPESEGAVMSVGGLICMACVKKEQNPPYAEAWPKKP